MKLSLYQAAVALPGIDAIVRRCTDDADDSDYDWLPNYTYFINQSIQSILGSWQKKNKKKHAKTRKQKREQYI